MPKLKVVGCIPSRFESSRLPGKPLSLIAGKPMILHVLERAKKAKRLDELIVLTDDARIFNLIRQAGHRVAMTSKACASGTDRIADYLDACPSGDIFVNIQGDEVLLDVTHVDDLIDGFLKNPEAEMGTLAHWLHDSEMMKNPSTTKVVTDLKGNALYFSRSCLPVVQNGAFPERVLAHIGVYIYTRKTLARLARLPQTPLEKTEKLEQLRALENGIKIGVTVVDDYQSLSVDTKEDLKKAQALFSKMP